LSGLEASGIGEDRAEDIERRKLAGGGGLVRNQVC
jgi:hypothetical protein